MYPHHPMFTRDRVPKEKQEDEKNPSSSPSNLTDRRKEKKTSIVL